MNKNVNDVTFQVTDLDYYHEPINQGDETLDKYNIRMYGITTDNRKIFVKVINFTPYFYVEIPKEWTKQKVQMLINTVKDEVRKSKRDSELVNSLKEWDLVDKQIFWEFTNYKSFTFLRLIFHNYTGFRAYERVFNRPIRNMILDPKPKKYKLYESNIEPMLRCMHTRKLNAVGWVQIKGGKYNYFTEETEISNNEISIYTDWTNLDHIADNNIAKITIASFDLECTSGDGSFPQPYRDEDKIIQIGTTFSRYGESECYFKHIITLGSCDPIEGATVESYDNEVAVLLAWTKLIQRENPDVITGYNIFGFDFMYLHERAEKFGCQKSFSKLGRIKNETSLYIQKELQSAALGRNKLTYYTMQGRINIDVMKVVQRDHKLGSYKLDNVAAEFIREGITSVNFNGNQTIINTKNTYGLNVGRYIKIYFNDGLSDNSYKNEAKFKVIDMTSKTITINGILDDEAIEFDKYTIYWCQAKDDVSPADIFRLQKGTSADRAIVAKYCIQDCELVNKLINKLQILTSNICMANVCHVPLSYIFLRGQGVKIFSLVSKKCRERNHVIPVIKKPFQNPNQLPIFNKPKEETEEQPEGYEGATVFEPTIAVHQEPITVLDFNSLYPSSMIFRNLSHECIVKNKQYDNLPGYHYEDISYSNGDGTMTKCRFAKSLNGPPGILAEILIELLNARASTRKQAEDEPDEFKAKILDCLQIALKVTSNSLYGQTGASTSPIYMKDIAASTCATGREMLNCARIFTEIIFPILIKAAFQSFESLSNKCDILFSKNIDLLIGGKNIASLKEIKEGEPVSRYSYLRVFKNSQDDISKKFTDVKLKHTCQSDFVKWVYDEILVLLKDYDINPNVIYGDTDSIFIKFNLADKITKQNDTTKESLKTSIRLGIVISKILHKILPSPENAGYEKTLQPLALLSKKRYVGNKYIFNPNIIEEQLSMGIVLKRRDNAPIVKIIIGGIVRSILNENDPKKAVEFAKVTLRQILSGKYSMDKFIITKTLKGCALTQEEQKIEEIKPKDQRSYSDRTRIVHAVLADRMAERDPGNRPASNDRIPYAYIITEKEANLQGDRVENPDYIVENNLPLDYLFYITNQIMKPAIQFLELIVDNPSDIFKQCIIKEMNRRTGKRPLSYYFDLMKELQLQDDTEPISYDTIQPQTLKRKKVVKKKSPKKTKSSHKSIVYDDDKEGFVLDL